MCGMVFGSVLRALNREQPSQRFFHVSIETFPKDTVIVRKNPILPIKRCLPAKALHYP